MDWQLSGIISALIFLIQEEYTPFASRNQFIFIWAKLLLTQEFCSCKYELISESKRCIFLLVNNLHQISARQTKQIPVQTVWVQMTVLVVSRLIRIYTVCHSVFDLRLIKSFFCISGYVQVQDGRVHFRNSGVKGLSSITNFNENGYTF